MTREHIDASRRSSDTRPVKVWDLPTRLFHWLVVILVVTAYVSIRLSMIDLHVRAGEALLALLFFRVLWGCFGSETARFRSFVASPADAFRHLRDLFHRDPDVQVGHNAAGGWMVLTLLALLLIETLSGLYVYNDVSDNGPLTDKVPAVISNGISNLHGFVWDVVLVAVVLHVCAIALYALAKGHNLVRPMVTGRKRLPAGIQAPRQASILLALLLLAIGAIAVAMLATWL